MNLRWINPRNLFGAILVFVSMFIVLKYVPFPCIWIGVLLFLLCSWISYRKENVRFAFYIIAIVCAVLTGIEAYSLASWSRDEVTLESVEGKEYFRSDDVVGAAANPDTYKSIRRTLDGVVIYEATYTIDKNGLRVLPRNDHARASILFFGCSFTFGMGVNDDQTMPHQVALQLSDYQGYNFGINGFGPHQTLALLESNRIEGVVKEAPRHAVYQLIPDHARRAVGRVPYHSNAPKYILADNQVVSNGFFHEHFLSAKVGAYARKSFFLSSLR